MQEIKKILNDLKKYGCNAIKISFEDEGALLNEITSMRTLTASLDIELSIKVGGCEAKRDILDCIYLGCDSIVAPMIESSFAITKFIKSLETYNYKGKKGLNIETINAYDNFDSIKENLKDIDFVTFGRVDFISSLNKDRDFAETDQVYDYVHDIFTKTKEINKLCFLGGAISIKSKDFIEKLIKDNLLDKFETRYVIFDVKLIDINNLDKLLYYANLFEVEWLKYISERYSQLAFKDAKRIKMIEERISINKLDT